MPDDNPADTIFASESSSRQTTLDLDMRVGERADVEPRGLGERFTSSFLGWRRKDFVLVGLPRRLGLADQLYPGKSVVVRWVSCTGRVWGFESEILGIIRKPRRMLTLAWPEFAEVVVLRGDNRVECRLPGNVEIGGTLFAGHVADISRGGLGFIADGAGPGRMAESVRCRFAMLDGRRHDVGCDVVKKRVDDEGRLRLGVRFQDVDEEAARSIGEYVDRLYELFGPACSEPDPD